MPGSETMATVAVQCCYLLLRRERGHESLSLLSNSNIPSLICCYCCCHRKYPVSGGPRGLSEDRNCCYVEDEKWS